MSVVKKLGQGGNGIVNLMKTNNNFYFVRKVGIYPLEKEINVIRKLSEVKGVPKIISYGKNHYDVPYNSGDKDLIDQFEELSINDIYNIIEQLTRIIKDAHRVGYAHRDIKLDNILYNKNTGIVTLIDWGSAIHIFSDEENDILHYGTPIYNPPEYFDNHYPDTLNAKQTSFTDSQKAIDVWQFGTVVFTLFTGKNHIDFDPKLMENDKSFREKVKKCEWKRTSISSNNLARYILEKVFRRSSERCSIDIFTFF